MLTMNELKYVYLVWMVLLCLQTSSSTSIAITRDTGTNYYSNTLKMADLGGKRKASRESPCPEAADILPCFCTIEDTVNINVECSSVTTEQLFNVFQQEFPVPSMNALHILDCSEPLSLNFSTNPISFEEIAFNDVGSLSIYDEFLASSSQRLRELSVIHADLTPEGFPFTTLSNYEVLDYLHLSRTELRFLPTISSSTLSFINIQKHDFEAIIPGMKLNLYIAE